MKNSTKWITLLLCNLAFQHTTMTSFLFHNGQTFRSGHILDLPELTTLNPSLLTEETVFIFADPNSPFPTEAYIVTISPNADKTKWAVSSTTIKNADLKVFNNLTEAQIFAFSKLQPNQRPEERIRIKLAPKDRTKWRKT